MRLRKDQLEVERIPEGIGRLRTVLESAIYLTRAGETEIGLLEKLTISFRERYGAESPLLGGSSQESEPWKSSERRPLRNWRAGNQ